MAITFNPGDLVKFATPMERGDEQAMFRVVELRGERVLVADADSTSPIVPTCVYLATDLVPARAGDARTPSPELARAWDRAMRRCPEIR